MGAVPAQANSKNSKNSAAFYSVQAGHVTCAADIGFRPDDHLCREFEKFFIAYETRGHAARRRQAK